MLSKESGLYSEASDEPVMKGGGGGRYRIRSALQKDHCGRQCGGEGAGDHVGDHSPQFLALMSL